MPADFNIVKEPLGASAVLSIFLGLVSWAANASYFGGYAFAMYAFVVLWLMEIALLIFWIFNMDGFRALSTAGVLNSQGPGSIWLATLLMLGIQTFLAFVSMCIQAGSASLSSSWQVAVAFGFITVFVTIGQMWFIFKEFRDSKSGAGGDANTTTTTTTTTVVTEQYDAPTADA